MGEPGEALPAAAGRSGGATAAPADAPDDGGTLAARAGRLHAHYRLGLEARRATAAPPTAGTRNVRLTLLQRLASLVTAGGAISPRTPRIVQNRLPIPNLEAALEGFTVAHLSDLHLDHRGTGSLLPLIEAVTSRRSDGLVLTGDLFARAPRTVEAVDALAEILSAVGPGTPAFAVLGDEDSLHLVPGLEDLGVRVLLNESVLVEHAGSRLYLAGIDDPAYYKADDIDAALQSIPAGATSILLSHSPEVFQQAAKAGFDVMLCGHTHGGQVCLPNGQPLLRVANAPRSVCRGHWQHGAMQGYTSSGCGTAPLNLRLNCPREVVFHTLCRPDSSTPD